MDNQVSLDIRSLIPVPEIIINPEELIEKVYVEQYLEKTEDIYLLNLISPKGAIDDLAHILRLEDPDLKGIAWACLGGVHTFNGNYQKAFSSFNIAMDQPVMGDVRSYTLIELSNLLRKLGYLREAVSLLETAMKITKREKLKWRIKTYIGLSFKYKNPDYSLSLLKESAEHYKKKNETFRLCHVIRHIGLVYVHMEDFHEAERYFNEAQTVAIEESLSTLHHDVMNDKGWLLIKQKKFDNARDLFEKLIQEDISPYEMSLSLQNLGYLEFERKNYREAIKFQSQSLQFSSKYEMRDMAFEDYYKLGLCHEKLEEIGLADHFYSIGYKQLIQEVHMGLPILGYRRNLLDAYVEFLRKYQKIPHIDMKDKVFGFAMNNTLAKIRYVFHKSLFSIHLEKTKNAPQLCQKLKINTRTYFLYQKKLGLKRGEPRKRFFEDNIYFNEYIESLTYLSWKEANQKFEDDLFSYLLTKYQYNKKKIAEVLGVSYALISLKTKNI